MSATSGTSVQAPDAVTNHPNATFALSSTPFAILIGWITLKIGLVMPQYVATACGTIMVGVLLIFRSAITRAGAAVWEFGIYGCCKRVWRGNQSPPAP